MNEIWILGATGRCGRAVAAQLAVADFSPVLVGREAARLHEVARSIGRDLRMVTAASAEAVAQEILRNKPAVVVNTIGPFAQTALPIARACLPGSHYIDISNELTSFAQLFGMQEEAVASGRSFVTGAGFGVLATESVVLKLCEGQPAAAKVRVDAMPMVETEPGSLGSALAASIVDGLAAGGRRYVAGRLERCRLFSDVAGLTRPDGVTIKTAGAPSGDLEAARRGSGASFVVAGSTYAPTTPMLRTLLPVVLKVLHNRGIRNFAKRRLAAVEIKPKGSGEVKESPVSWAHASVEWPSGLKREGWLRLGDAMTFTTQVMAQVAMHLSRGDGRPGIYTPGALLGPDLALAAGGQFLLD